MLFHEELDSSRAVCRNSPVRRFIESRGEKLILDLSMPRTGERLLDVGCGTGEHLLLFRNQGCSVTGVERSLDKIESARNKLGHRADIYAGEAEDLPFSDNEFDIVTLIASLELAGDPQKAIREAIRVSRDRVFMGVWNKYAVLNFYGGFDHFLCAGRDERPVRLLGLLELVRWIRDLLPGVSIQWGSVIYFPLQWYTFMADFELRIPANRNPFGAFLGLSFSVQASYRTIQDVIREPLGVNAKSSQALRGVARELKR
ncbi:class I SAM-dependent methyltransferase [Syntrophus aciditrophicus]|uniref:SAM-dependent methyltransferase n=1 Tax=Syntrophus aciditrophicus (strain SB) TaxID=56780 RepID=Q2LR02_SYNAS|nr:class I SAM-dependent methyltransferase [Syntrophus aciditrophicus]ABC76514.1 SAM-dependent methyltransferase [Syntrophus aciditrophicus SB]OPY18314.1 MAG: Demethylrebeccamycin-D-glucose O-methyltransferase [Syntrophus sp. PtaB.Bin075]